MNFSELYRYIKQKADYQKENDMDVEGLEIIARDMERGVAIIRKKSNGDELGYGLFLCFDQTPGKDSRNWRFWCPSKEQLEFITQEFVPKYNELQSENGSEEDKISSSVMVTQPSSGPSLSPADFAEVEG